MIPSRREPTSADSFDLASLPPDRHTWIFRISFQAALIIPVGGFAWYAVTLPRSYWTTPGGDMITGFVVLFTALLVLGIVGLGPGATRCVFDPSGFTLTFRRGSAKRYEWANPRLKLTLVEAVRQGRAEYSLSTGIPFTTNLSPALFARLLEEARTRGLSVRLEHSSIPTVSRGPDIELTTYRIAHAT